MAYQNGVGLNPLLCFAVLAILSFWYYFDWAPSFRARVLFCVVIYQIPLLAVCNLLASV